MMRKQRHRSKKCAGKDKKSAQSSAQGKQNSIPPKPAGIRFEAAERIILENEDPRQPSESETDRENEQ